MKGLFFGICILFILSGCSKKEKESIVSPSSETTEIVDSQHDSSDKALKLFITKSDADFREGETITVNDNDIYRSLMFDEIETGSLIVGAGSAKKIFNIDGVTAVLINTKSTFNSNTGLYDMLSKQPEFSGDAVLLLFKEKPRVLENDTLAFKGVVFQGLYKYINKLDEEKTIPVLMVSKYISGRLLLPEIHEFLTPTPTPTPEKTPNDTRVKVDDRGFSDQLEKSNKLMESKWQSLPDWLQEELYEEQSKWVDKTNSECQFKSGYSEKVNCLLKKNEERIKYLNSFFTK